MPAPSYQVLLDIPGNVAAAAKAIAFADITALIGSDTHANANAFIFGPRENVVMPVDHIEVTASDFVTGSMQQVLSTTNDTWWPADYVGSITFAVVTPRSVAVAAAEHSKRVGRIGFLMSPAAQRFTANNLPYYTVCEIGVNGLPRAEVDDEQDADRTEITYNLRVWLKPDSFPVVVP